jgi:hypothetical protein
MCLEISCVVGAFRLYFILTEISLPLCGRGGKEKGFRILAFFGMVY